MQMAANEGTDAEQLVKDAALRLGKKDASFRAPEREGIARGEGGQTIEEWEMDARRKQKLRS